MDDGRAGEPSRIHAGLVRQRPNTCPSWRRRPATASAASNGPNALRPAPAMASGAGVRCCIQASAVGSASSHVDAHASVKNAAVPPVSAVAELCRTLAPAYRHRPGAQVPAVVDSVARMQRAWVYDDVVWIPLKGFAVTRPVRSFAPQPSG